MRAATGLDVVRVDPHDDSALGAWHAVTTASLRDLWPDDVHPPFAEVRAAVLAGQPDREPPPSELLEPLLAVDGGRAVGAARVELPQRDNTHLLYVEIHVVPDARRRGAGTALLTAATARAREAGRPLLLSELEEPPHLRDRSPGRAFLEASGLSCALEEIRRDLALPPDAARLAALEVACLPHATGYRVLTWRDRCPDELVEGRAALGRAMSTSVPLGTLDWREETWDAARVREREQLLGEQGRTSVVAAALHEATGEVVGFTEMVARPAEPELAEQWETLVLAPHRGHRLGTLLKIAAVRRLVAELPQVRRLATGNASTNAPMIAVNEAMGFVPNGSYSSWQRAV